MLATVEEITDKLGQRVDERIKETVAILLIYGFNTIGSCEGHVTEEGKHRRGLPYPWVDICEPEPEGWKIVKGKEKEKLKEEWRRKNFKKREKLIKLLEEFYQKRRTSYEYEVILIVSNIGPIGAFRLQSLNAESTEMLPGDEQRKKLSRYQKEIKDFTEFLLNKYL
ncbi:MAG: hypothetical protein NZ866_02585, partial [Patescibacteria group bacterium]|nr:hypothetical protein [Patescibacteria group bacterium]